MKKMKNSHILFTFLLLFVCNFLVAQTGVSEIDDAIGFNPVVADVPDAPINFLIYILAITAGALSLKKLKQ